MTRPLDVMLDDKAALVLRVHGEQRDGAEGRGLVIYTPSGVPRAVVAERLRDTAQRLENA